MATLLTLLENTVFSYKEAGLLRDVDRHAMSMGMTGVYVGSLTNAGYDFLEEIRQEAVWITGKDTIIQKGLPMIPKTISAIAGVVIKNMTEGAVTAILKQQNTM